MQHVGTSPFRVGLALGDWRRAGAVSVPGSLPDPEVPESPIVGVAVLSGLEDPIPTGVPPWGTGSGDEADDREERQEGDHEDGCCVSRDARDDEQEGDGEADEEEDHS